jgi:hypothetical protein
MLKAHGRAPESFSDFVTAPPRSEMDSWVIASAAFLLIALRQTYVLPGIPLGLGPGRFLLFVAAGWFIYSCVVGQKSLYRLGAVAGAAAVYFVSTLLAYGMGMTQEAIPVRQADTYLVVEIMLVLSVFYYVNVVHSYIALGRVIKGLVAGGVVSAVFAIVASASGVELAPVLRPPGLVEKGVFLTTDVFRVYVVRPQGSADHPLELAAVLTIMFPLAVGLTYSLRAGGQRWRLWAMATFIILVGVAVSVSRSALIALFVACVFMALFWPIRRTLAMVGGALGLAAVGFAVRPSLFEAYSSLFGLGFDDASSQNRVAAAQYIATKVSVFGSFARGAGTSGHVIFDDQYLHRLAETGLFGLFAYMMLLGTALVLAIRAFFNARKRTNPDLPAASAQLFLGLAASFIAYAVMNITLDVGGFVQIWTTMWLLLGSAAVAFRISRKADHQMAAHSLQLSHGA